MSQDDDENYDPNINLRKFLHSVFPVYMNLVSCIASEEDSESKDLLILQQSQTIRHELSSLGTDTALLLEQSMHLCEVFCLHSDQTLSLELTRLSVIIIIYCNNNNL